MADLIYGMPWGEYGRGGYLGSSAIHDWRSGEIGREAWAERYLCERPYSDGGSDSRAILGGSALDALLTGETFAERFVVAPDGYDARTKAWKEWAASVNGKSIISSDHWSEIEAALPRAREGVRIIQQIYGEPSYQVTLRGELGGTKVQTRPDIVCGNAIVDLKYCGTKAFNGFDRDFVRGRYYPQSGLFYGLASTYDPAMSWDVYFLLIEAGTVHPRSRLVKIPPHVLSRAVSRVEEWAVEIHDAIESASMIDALQATDLALSPWDEERL